MPKPRDPFELTLSDEQRSELALFLCDELQRGLDARASQEQDVDYWWTLYEQARTRLGRSQPWPDAADLTSYLASEKVDALQARIMRTVFGVDPVYTVEGWGDAADRAPFVEEVNQWWVEEERLQGVIDKLILMALVEPRGLLEVSEGTELRTTRKRISAKVETDPVTGGMVFGDDLQPLPLMGADGKYATPTEQDYAVDVVVDQTEKVRTGPVYRILPYRDSAILPGHARDKEDIWAYAKRFWRRYDDLTRKAAAGVYDAEAVERMSRTHEREPDAALTRSQMSVAPSEDANVEKELWEMSILLDLDAFFKERDLPLRRQPELKGERWYLCTLHLNTQQMLRFQHDDLERSRFVSMILFPRPDRATEGFSFIGHKLITTIEEHTAWRNMAADRASMVVNAPIKRLQGALWEPSEQPFGPKAVIDVRDMREIEPLVVPDFTAPVLNHIQMMERTAERLAGINDIASGQVSEESRTLGEVQMATESSFVRMDLIVRRAQEAMEDLGIIRHEIRKRVLAEQQDGIEAPRAVLNSLEGRGVSVDQYMPDKKVTAALLAGAFRFKPRGSVETADPGKQRQDFVQAMQMLPMILQAFPFLAMQFQSMQAARAMGRQFLRVFRVENQQAFLGSPAQDVQQSMMLNAMAQMGPQMGQMAPQMGGAPVPGPVPARSPGAGTPPGAGAPPPQAPPPERVM